MVELACAMKRLSQVLRVVLALLPFDLKIQWELVTKTSSCPCIKQAEDGGQGWPGSSGPKGTLLVTQCRVLADLRLRTCFLCSVVRASLQKPPKQSFRNCSAKVLLEIEIEGKKRMRS